MLMDTYGGNPPLPASPLCTNKLTVGLYLVAFISRFLCSSASGTLTLRPCLFRQGRLACRQPQGRRGIWLLPSRRANGSMPGNGHQGSVPGRRRFHDYFTAQLPGCSSVSGPEAAEPSRLVTRTHQRNKLQMKERKRHRICE